jgi:hypothetical protein
VIVGHLGIAGAAYAVRRDSSLVWLLGASLAPDVIDAMFVVAGSCNPHGLYSHTLPAAALIGAVTGAVAWAATGRRVIGVLAALLVLAHLPLDYVTGQKLFWPGGELAGLRLYDYPMADFAVESVLAGGGWWLVRSRSWAPRWATGWLALAAALVLQGTLDIVGARNDGVKPTACAPAMPVATD